MAPNVTLHFFDAKDINGSVLHEITDEDSYFKKLTLKLERDGLGGAELVLARKVGFAGFGSGTFNPEVFVRVIISAYSDTIYYPWGFFLDKRQQTVVHVDEDGGEEFHFGGPGPKQYLDRSALGIEQLTGTGWNLDLENGVWRWNSNATAGDVLRRIYLEDQARDDPTLPDLTLGFSAATDSNSNAWTDDDLGGPDQFELPIGQSLLTCLWDIDDVIELTSWIELGTVAAPIFELNVAEGLGLDKTGSAVGAGVCLLKEGLNIANKSLVTEGNSLKKASHIIVEGNDGNWVEVARAGFSSGDYVKVAKIEYRRSNSVFWLEKAGLRWLKRQDHGEKEHTIEILPGTSDATGYYFPAPNRNLWLSNLISLDTSEDGVFHTPLDIQPSEDQLVTGILLETHQASDDTNALAETRSWDVSVILNRERPGLVRRTPNQNSATTEGGTCNCPALCHPAVEGTPDTLVKFYNANDPGGDALNWTGSQQDQGGSGKGANGTDWYVFKSASPHAYQTTWEATAGASYSVSGWVGCDSDGFLVLAFTNLAPGSAGTGVVGGSVLANHVLTPAQPGHQHAPVWTGFSAGSFIAPPGTTSAALGRQTGVSFDEVSIFRAGTPASNPYNGDAARAARCDHVHPASEIVFDPTSTISADNVQDAIEEVAADAAAALDDAVEGLAGEQEEVAFAITAAPEGGWGRITKNNALSYGGHTYIGYVTGDDGDVKIAVIDNDDPETVLATATLHAALDVDDHSAPSLLVRDSDHKLLAVYSSHGDSTVRLRISTTSLDTDPDLSDGFATEVSLDAQLGSNTYTYPTIVQLTGEVNDPIYLFVRAGGSGSSADWFYSTSTDNGTTWAALTNFFGESTRWVYVKPVVNGTTRIDFVANDGSPVDDTNVSTGHFYYEAAAWHASDGTSLGALPLDGSDMTVIADGSANETSLLDIAIGDSGFPVVAYADIDDPNNHVYHHAVWNGSVWDDTIISANGGGNLEGTDTFSGHLALDADDPTIVYASVVTDGQFEIFRFTTDGSSWSGEALTTDSAVKHIRPISVVNHDSELQAVWLAGSYSGIGTFSLGIMGVGITATLPGPTDLAGLTDVTLLTPALGDMLRFDGAQWVNTPGRWEPMTDGVDTFVWDGDEIVMGWKDN